MILEKGGEKDDDNLFLGAWSNWFFVISYTYFLATEVALERGVDFLPR